jgi:hypothetical protein
MGENRAEGHYGKWQGFYGRNPHTTDTMKHGSPTFGSNTCLIIPEFPLLWNPKIRCHVFENLSLTLILGQMNPLYIFTTIRTLVVSFCLHLRLSNRHFRFSDRNLVSFAPWLGLPIVDISDSMENSGVLNYDMACLWWFSDVKLFFFVWLHRVVLR